MHKKERQLDNKEEQGENKRQKWSVMTASSCTELIERPGPGPALVFGASGEQGRAVIEGVLDHGYNPVYGFTRSSVDNYLTDALGCNLISGDIANPDDIKKALLSTKAKAVFLVTTTDLPGEIGETTGFWNAMEDEYETILEFFTILIQVYKEDKLERHVVLSTCDNVQDICRDVVEKTGKSWIEPLDDGSIVPHYSAKGRAGEKAQQMLDEYSPALSLTRITLPFLYSNFLGFFAPLPADESKTQWQITACFGDGATKIDMMSVSDLSTLVPNIFEQRDKYNKQNLRLAAERISMDEIAAAFANLFGKDVIYNPLYPSEVAELPFPSAPAMAQMCQFWGDPRSLQHNIELTQKVLFPKKPQTFSDWLLTHSDSTAFIRVGLDFDAPEIKSVTVFGATTPQGKSVIQGLLNDTRKEYMIRGTTRHLNSDKCKALEALCNDAETKRLEMVFADLDDIDSCTAAVDGMDGAFLVTDFFQDAERHLQQIEEKHAKNVIDACEASHSVKHLVFSTMENIEEMNRVFDLGLEMIGSASSKAGNDQTPTSNAEDQKDQGIVVQFDAKAKAAAYARTKKLSVTYVLMPCYSELFFDMIERRLCKTTGEEKLVLTVPIQNKDAKVMCMSVDDLGPAVANIFDSYQVYAGHEIGLVTDFVTASEVKDIIQDVFLATDEKNANQKQEEEKSKEQDKENVATKIETEHKSNKEWVEARDTYMKDLGQMFAYLSHTDAVKKRHSIAKTMKLVPSARPLRQWVEENKDNPSFREKLGLR